MAPDNLSSSLDVLFCGDEAAGLPTRHPHEPLHGSAKRFTVMIHMALWTQCFASTGTTGLDSESCLWLGSGTQLAKEQICALGLIFNLSFH